ncbi:AmmeMemoRadiSam system radical SAM enzyme [candidate division WOR-3 bacterium]|nr:AmmeMemoRadiSam system radical SAM enzyme [candidate division WOR-3 bacterium]
MQEARYYEKLSDGSVKCELCPHSCIIKPNTISPCKARKNVDSILYAINYGECVSLAMDTIEKKPLYHFHPGTLILSTAPNSCNFKCPYCQNYGISQGESSTQYVSPEELVQIALRKSSLGIAYTYTEPFTWYEYLIDTAKIARSKGLKNVLVTNGMINEKPLSELLPYIDAANIDLKSMDPEFYKKIVWGDLDTVLNTIKITKRHWHIELTNLIIPGYNDSPELIQSLVDFVASIGVDTPLHFSRYFPHYKFKAPPTPIETLKFAGELARKKLQYVYIGNILLEESSGIGDWSSTYCPECGNLLINRSYLDVSATGITDNRCNKCGRKADFVI